MIYDTNVLYVRTFFDHLSYVYNCITTLSIIIKIKKGLYRSFIKMN